jgi:hypothetical protein
LFRRLQREASIGCQIVQSISCAFPRTEPGANQAEVLRGLADLHNARDPYRHAIEGCQREVRKLFRQR